MSFSNEFFRFPVKIYNSIEYRSTLEKDLSCNTDTPIEYCVGWIACKMDDILGWQDFYDKGRHMQDIKNDGFDSCIVYTKEFGEIECPWTTDKLVQKMDLFAESINYKSKKENKK